MDVLRFVNSKDIRAHLEQIRYPFNSLEAAWLIYQCRTVTLEEKYRAWEELIACMPDCSIPRRFNTEPQESLHQFLKTYIALQKKHLRRFRGEVPDPEPSVYKIEYRCKGGSSYEESTVFSRFETAMRFVAQNDDPDAVSVFCTKLRVDVPYAQSVLKLSPDGTAMEWLPGKIDAPEESRILSGVFDGLWFEFPTPFRPGDILWDPQRPSGYCGGPFAETSIDPEGMSSERAKESVRKNGDGSDMCARGYFCFEDGEVYYDCMSNYMDLEYYTGELTDGYRVLIPLSNFLKGKIDTGLYTRAYHQIVAACYADSCKPNGFTGAGLVLAGLKKAEHVKLWLDDVRDAPQGYERCKSVNEAKGKILAYEQDGTVIDVIDCDHDLGEYAADGGDGIKLIDWLAERNTCYPIALHTMNPVGRANMQRAIDRYWKDAPK